MSAAIQVGARFGDREVIAAAGRGKRGERYQVRCLCGRKQIVDRSALTQTRECGTCARQRNGRAASKGPAVFKTEAAAVLAEAGQAWPQLWRGWSDESMAACAELALSGPLTLHEIAALLGMSPEGARLIEAAALKKLRARMALIGLSAADITERVTLWDEIAAIDRMEAA
jgi:hypothetical protein